MNGWEGQNWVRQKSGLTRAVGRWTTPQGKPDVERRKNESSRKAEPNKIKNHMDDVKADKKIPAK